MIFSEVSASTFFLLGNEMYRVEFTVYEGEQRNDITSEAFVARDIN